MKIKVLLTINREQFTYRENTGNYYCISSRLRSYAARHVIRRYHHVSTFAISLGLRLNVTEQFPLKLTLK